jgi:hypothetical protein
MGSSKVAGAHIMFKMMAAKKEDKERKFAD